MKTITTTRPSSIDGNTIHSMATNLSQLSQEIKKSQRCCGLITAAAGAIAALILGAMLQKVTVDGHCDYRWLPGFDAEQLEDLQDVIRMVGSRALFEWLIGFRLTEYCMDNPSREAEYAMYLQAPHEVRESAHEILLRADFQRAFLTLIAALLVHRTLTGEEAAEIILMAFVEE